MTRQRLEFKPNHTTKRGLITGGKISSLMLTILGIATIVLSVINDIDIIFGIGITITGVVVGIFTYFYGRQATTGTIWIEGPSLYMQGGGLPDGYVRCMNLQNLTEIVYNPKYKTFILVGKNNLVIYDEQKKMLRPVGAGTELRGVDDYTPSIVETLQKIRNIELTIGDKRL